MKYIILFLFCLFSFFTEANTQKVIEALRNKKVVSNEKIIVLSEDTQGKNSFFLAYGEYDYHGSKEAEYIVAIYNQASGTQILIRDQALHGMIDGVRKAADIPTSTREKILLAYGAHRTPTDADYKTFKNYIAKKIKKNRANSDEKWLHAKLKAPAKR